MWKQIVLAILVVALAYAENWEDFRVKYDLNPIGHFNRQPKVAYEASFNGWTKISDTCTNKGDYLGFRYIVEGDNSLVLLFDVNGVIAGLQMLLPHSEILVDNPFKFDQVSFFNNETIDGEEYFVLTAYLVNPDIICTTGRNESDLVTIGTGEGVWIQDGQTPKKFLEIPQIREDALKSNWSNNNCFAGMGTHSWYRMEDYEATNCTVQVPVFGLWNRAHELMGFGFSVSGTTQNPHFENPPSLAVSLIAGDVMPDCLIESNDLIGQTTMHVYFVDTPWFIIC